MANDYLSRSYDILSRFGFIVAGGDQLGKTLQVNEVLMKLLWSLRDQPSLSFRLVYCFDRVVYKSVEGIVTELYQALAKHAHGTNPPKGRWQHSIRAFVRRAIVLLDKNKEVINVESKLREAETNLLLSVALLIDRQRPYEYPNAGFNTSLEKEELAKKSTMYDDVTFKLGEYEEVLAEDFFYPEERELLMENCVSHDQPIDGSLIELFTKKHADRRKHYSLEHRYKLRDRLYDLANVLRIMYNCLHEFRVFGRNDEDELEYQLDHSINPSLPLYYNKYEPLALFVVRGAFKAVRYLIQEQFADILDTDIVLDEEDIEDEIENENKENKEEGGTSSSTPTSSKEEVSQLADKMATLDGPSSSSKNL